jgi:hypothetical protein
MTIEDEGPAPEPRGDLVPPPRNPPTAVGASTPSRQPQPPRPLLSEIYNPSALLAFLTSAITSTLDVLDAAGDAVAERLGIR